MSDALPTGPRGSSRPRRGIAFYQEAGLLILQARRSHTGGVILDMADLSDEALALTT